MVTLPLGVTACGLLIAFLGTRTTLPNVPAWPRFWASVFFIVLFWPIGVALAERLGGRRVATSIAAVLLLASLLQQAGYGTMPLPRADEIRMAATLISPGDAIRQRITLPLSSDRRWRDAVRRAHRAAVTVCTWEPVGFAAHVTVSVNGGRAVPVHSLPRFGDAAGWGWYVLDVPRDLLTDTPRLDVIVAKEADGPPARICGGRDDPRRPGAGGASRFFAGRWQDRILADPLAGAPAGGSDGPTPTRYFVELRLFDAEGHASVGIWH